ncbi:MAG: phage portal protein [Chloroflexi bacterium]|nr:phage portal protein [Chloroflexota bacterium]
MFDRLRKRSATTDADYTEQVINKAVANADGTNNRVTEQATGALETAAGLIGRAIAAAEVGGSDQIMRAVTPPFLLLVARSLIKRGELVVKIDTGGADGLRLYPANTHTIKGDMDQSTWLYDLDIPGPTYTSSYQDVRSESVLHFRYAVDPVRSWVGLSPVAVASAAGQLSANVAGSLRDEAGSPRGFLLSVPSSDGAAETLDGLRNQIAQLNGRVATVEAQYSLAANTGLRTNRDWSTVRLGGDPPQPFVSLLSTATKEVLTACGVPQALVTVSDGGGQREAWRQFLFGTIAPLGMLIKQELNDKLDENIDLSFNELRASDLAGRARAFQSLVKGGLDIERAAGLSGMIEADE